MGLNELMFFSFIVLDMALVVLMYRLFGKEGLFGYVVLAVITCNIEVIKQVDMFGWPVTLGNVLYGSIFLTCDILAEVYGKKEAQKAVWLGFAMFLLCTLFTQISLHFTPNSFDTAQPHMEAIFGFLPRIMVASMLAYLIAQSFDVWLFVRFKQLLRGRILWLRANVSILLSQALDSVIFCTLAFAPVQLIGAAGLDSWATVWKIALTTYVLKLIVSMMDTPFLYLARAIGQKHYPPSPERDNGLAPARA